jgi:hypothetical protein
MKLLLKVLVSGAGLALLFSFLPWSAVEEAFRRLPFLVWFAVLTGVVVGHTLSVIKWSGFVNAGRAGLSRADGVMCYSAGLFANLCLPTVVGGDIVRAGLASRVSGRSEAAIWGGVLDRVTDVLALAVIVVLGGLFSGPAMSGWLPRVALVVGLIGVAGATLVIGLGFRRPLASWPRRVRRPLGRSLVALRRLRRNPVIGLRGFLLALSIQSWFVVLNVWLGESLGITVPVAAWFFAWPLAKIAGLLPISLGGLAVREAGLAALLLPFGVPAALSVVSALVWQSMFIVTSLIGGLVWLALSRHRQPGLRLRWTPSGSARHG